MRIEEYISAGTLEAYALGELNAEERDEVEIKLSQYPQLKAELRLVEKLQERLILEAAITPRSEVKRVLLSKIDQQRPENKVSKAHAEKANLIFWKYALAATVSFALVSSYLAYNYYNMWLLSENNLSKLIAQNQHMAQNYNTVTQKLDKIKGDIAVIDNPEFRRIVMKGTNNAPNAMAYLYWNASTKSVYLSIQNMKALPKENQYQLWAIIDGKPVDAGVFNTPAAGLLKMKDISLHATTFAVTIEPFGGKSAPSLATMQMVGNVISS